MMNAECVQEQDIGRKGQLIDGSSIFNFVAALLMTCEDSSGIWHQRLLQMTF